LLLGLEFRRVPWIGCYGYAVIAAAGGVGAYGMGEHAAGGQSAVRIGERPFNAAVACID